MWSLSSIPGRTAHQGMPSVLGRGCRWVLAEVLCVSLLEGGPFGAPCLVSHLSKQAETLQEQNLAWSYLYL